MKSDNYVVIQGFMCNELELKGNELLVFALIYGFSQDGMSYYNGGRKYISDTFNISLPTVDKALQSLLNKDLIIKEGLHNASTDIYYVNYEVVKKLYGGSKETLHSSKKTLLPGSKETLHNNTNNKNINKTISKDIVQNSKRKSLYDKCLDMIAEFTDDIILRDNLVCCLKMFLENSKENNVPFYSNTFKGKLNKLKQFSTDNDIQKKIVLQTLDNGWNNFYELKENKSFRKNRDTRQDIEGLSTDKIPIMSDEEKKELQRRINNGEIEQF